MLTVKISAIHNAIFTTDIDVRVENINYGNHLGNDALVSLLHESRVRFLKKYNYSEFDIEGSGILVTGLTVNYLSEAFHGDVLKIAIALGEVSATSVELIYQIQKQGAAKDVARAATTITFFNYQERKVAKVPPAFLAALS